MSPVRSIAVPLTLAAMLVAYPLGARQAGGGLRMRSSAASPLVEVRRPGVRGALTIACQSAAATLSQPDGFLKTPARVTAPPGWAKAEATLRSIGLSTQVDQLLLSLNRAAEDVAGQAPAAFAPAIAALAIPPGLTPGDGKATALLRQAAATQIATALRPMVEAALATSGATQRWVALTATYNKVALTPVAVDLVEHVDRSVLDALFARMAVVEAAGG